MLIVREGEIIMAMGVGVSRAEQLNLISRLKTTQRGVHKQRRLPRTQLIKARTRSLKCQQNCSIKSSSSAAPHIDVRHKLPFDGH
jgi:hypothetical protein